MSGKATEVSGVGVTLLLRFLFRPFLQGDVAVSVLDTGDAGGLYQLVLPTGFFGVYVADPAA